MKKINEVLAQLESGMRTSMAIIKNAEVIKNQLLVVRVEDEEQIKVLKNYASINKVLNLLILSADKNATFLGDEGDCLYFNDLFSTHASPYNITGDVWEIGLELEKEMLPEDIRKKFESRDFYLGEMSSFAFVLSQISQMRSRWANSIREGFISGMKEARNVEYKLYCIATILEKRIDDACAGRSDRDKMVLTLVKQELEELIASEDFRICQEMNTAGACHVLSHHVQRFAKQMLELLKEITK